MDVPPGSAGWEAGRFFLEASLPESHPDSAILPPPNSQTPPNTMSELSALIQATLEAAAETDGHEIVEVRPDQIADAIDELLAQAEPADDSPWEMANRASVPTVDPTSGIEGYLFLFTLRDTRGQEEDREIKVLIGNSLDEEGEEEEEEA